MISSKYLLQKSFSSVLLFLFASFFHMCLSWWPKYVDLTKFFCNINESVWEHMKMAWWAAIVVAFIEMIFFHWSKNRNFIMSKIFSSIILITIIPILFYSYTYFIASDLVIDIIILIIAIIIAQIFEYLLMTKTHFYWAVYYISLFAFLMVSYLFMSFSVNAPDLILFK